MNNETRSHIRCLLWRYKKTEKSFKDFVNILTTDQNPFLEFSMTGDYPSWTMNQIIFHKMFLSVVNDVLADSTDDIKNIFNAKYVYGYPKKGNDLVAVETFLSESTVKRRDNEFIREIAGRLGWLEV